MNLFRSFSFKTIVVDGPWCLKNRSGKCKTLHCWLILLFLGHPRFASWSKSFEREQNWMVNQDLQPLMLRQMSCIFKNYTLKSTIEHLSNPCKVYLNIKLSFLRIACSYRRIDGGGIYNRDSAPRGLRPEWQCEMKILSLQLWSARRLLHSGTGQQGLLITSVHIS